MSKLHLSEKEARQVILSAQGLLTPFESPLAAMQALLAVQSQYPGNLLPALFARSRGTTLKKLERILQKDRTFYKTWSLRHTLHAHSTEDRNLLHGAIGVPFHNRFKHQCLKANWFTEETYQLCQVQVLEVLREGPLLRSDIHERVPILKSIEYAGWGMDVKGLAYEGKIVFADQAAARTSFVASTHWFGCDSEPTGTLTEVLRRYLRGHGLATQVDFRYWTLRDARSTSRAFEALEPELEEVAVEGKSQTYYKLRELEISSGKPKVKLLAKFDPLILGWKDKSLYLDDKYLKRVSMPAAQVEATVLVQGKVSATWRQSKGNGDSLVFTIFPFKSFSEKVKAQIVSEATRLAKAQGKKQLTVTFCDP